MLVTAQNLQYLAPGLRATASARSKVPFCLRRIFSRQQLPTSPAMLLTIVKDCLVRHLARWAGSSVNIERQVWKRASLLETLRNAILT